MSDQLALILGGLGVQLRTNRNRRTMLSLRQQKDGSWRLSIHEDLLRRDECHIDILRFVKMRGKGEFPLLRAAMQAVADEQLQTMQDELGIPTAEEEDQGDGKAAVSEEIDFPIEPTQNTLDQQLAHALPGEPNYIPPAAANEQRSLEQPRAQQPWHDWPRLGESFSFGACYDETHARWFSDISKPPWHWSRDPGKRQLQSLRFGAYHSMPQPVITLSPRLNQAWIPQRFVEYIIFHELCHHRQYINPIRGEQPHSKRFRAWEREYPHYKIITAWERAHRMKMLAPPH